MCNSFTSLLANYVYTKHTPLSFASWCMLHIHNSASLRGVCADTPLSFASLVYLLHRIRIRIKNKIVIQSTYKILSESNNLTITSRENKKGHGKWQGRAGEGRGGRGLGWEGQGRARRQGGGGGGGLQGGFSSPSPCSF